MAVVYTDPDGQQNDIMPNIVGITNRLDEIIQREALTAGMAAESAFIQATNNAAEFKLATILTSGLGNYDKQLGYPRGSTSLSWETYKLRYDRGVHLDVDRLDQMQSGGVATIGAMAANLARQHIIPEVDATRFATIAERVSEVASTENYKSEALTKANILAQIDAAMSAIYDATGVDSGLTIYVNSALRSALNMSSEYQRTKDIATARNVNLATKSIDDNALVFVPANRMYDAIDMIDVDPDAGLDGGYKAAEGAHPINFVITTPGAVNAITSFQAPKFIAKDVNQNKDADAYMTRMFHDLIVPKNQVKRLYVSVGTSTVSA